MKNHALYEVGRKHGLSYEETKVCYCNAENIIACHFKDSKSCPRVCRLFTDEDSRLEKLFVKFEKEMK